MFYKLMNNDIVTDLLKKVCYVRYLPQAQRWVITDAQSAHGVRGSDQNTIYLLDGRVCAYKEPLTMVRVVEIAEEEYNKLAEEIAMRKKENEDLYNKINSLEQTLANQNELLLQLLAKLN